MSQKWFVRLVGGEHARCGIISVVGADALSFLHNQLTNSVEDLRPGEMRLAGYCSVKGRLLADCLMWRDDVPGADPAEGVPRVLLLVNREILAPLMKRLSMFVLRAKAKLTDASGEIAVFGVAGDLETTPEHARRMALVAGLQHIVSAAENADAIRAALGPTHTEAPAASWDAHRIACGVPHVSLATQDKFVPQMVNFELIGGIDFKKGCFPGQEVVARSQYLGKMKRRSYLAQVTATQVAAGAALFAAGGEEIGNVVSAAQHQADGADHGGADAFDLLAELPTESAHDGAVRLGAPDGPALSFRTLPYEIPLPAPMIRPKL